MNRKLMMTLTAVILVAGLAAGATFAVFTSSKQNSSNVFTAGTLIIGAPNAGTNGTMHFGPAAPGDATTKDLYVRNLGTMPFWYRVSAEMGDECTGDLYDALDVSIISPIGWPVVGSAKLAELDKIILNSNMLPTPAGDAGEKFEYILSLPIDAGNELQGEKADVTFKFEAFQLPAPTEDKIVSFSFSNSGQSSVQKSGSTTLTLIGKIKNARDQDGDLWVGLKEGVKIWMANYPDNVWEGAVDFNLTAGGNNNEGNYVATIVYPTTSISLSSSNIRIEIDGVVMP